MQFEYLYERTATGVIEIEDISCCCIEAFNDIGQVFYLLTKTEAGYTKILTFGPTLPEFPGMMPHTYNASFKRIQYNTGKIIKEITAFLQNPYSRITQAIEQDPQFAMSQFISIDEYYQDGGFGYGE